MEGHCLRTRLVENAAVCLYYKGMEEDGDAQSALDAEVAFSPADALIMDKESAKLLCDQLNEDKAILLANGYTAFEISPLCVANTNDYH